MNEKNFQTAVRFGPIVVGLCVLLNIWLVMRYREIYRDAAKAEAQLKLTATQEQALRGVLQEFAARANSDAHIAEIFKQAQAAGAAQAAAAGQRTQH